MGRGLFRVARRFASFAPEAQTALADVIRVEFSVGDQPDLELSVYEADDSAAAHLRVFAEHVAGSRMGPKLKNGKLIDVSGLAEAVPLDEEGPFRFSREAHRVLRFDGPSEQAAFVTALLRDAPSRTRAVPKADARKYVLGRLADRDPEWIAIVEAHPDWAEHYGVATTQ